MREDGLIEFKGHLINPNIVVAGQRGAVVWADEQIKLIGGIEVMKRVSVQILKEWSESNGD